MNWEDQLIQLYCDVCTLYQQEFSELTVDEAGFISDNFQESEGFEVPTEWLQQLNGYNN